MIKPHELIGSWQLDDWTIECDDGRTLSRPFGEGAQGVLIYAADGAMAVSIMRAGRASLSNANARKAPEAERAAAFDGYFGYAGRWRLADGEMVHEIEQALNPDFVGHCPNSGDRLPRRCDGVERAPDHGIRRHDDQPSCLAPSRRSLSVGEGPRG